MVGLVRVQSGTDDSVQEEVRTPTSIGQFAHARSALRPDHRVCAGLAVDAALSARMPIGSVNRPRPWVSEGRGRGAVSGFPDLQEPQ
jgi:hypothetical protein